MRWLARWLWRAEKADCDQAVQVAEALRDRAQEQQRRAREIVPRVDAAVRADRRFMIENAVRGAKR